MKNTLPPPLTSLDPSQIDALPAVQIGPGCSRRDLPSGRGIRTWIVDIAAGSQWPYVDSHDEMGEGVFVISGEVIEGNERYGAGTYLLFGPGSAHQPISESGVRLFGFNLIADCAKTL